MQPRKVDGSMKISWSLIAITAGSLYLGGVASSSGWADPKLDQAAQKAQQAVQTVDKAHKQEATHKTSTKHTAAVKVRQPKHDSGSIFRGVHGADASAQGRVTAEQRRQEDLRKEADARQKEAQRKQDEVRQKAVQNKQDEARKTSTKHTAAVKVRRPKHDSGSILQGVRGADASSQGRVAAEQRRQEDLRKQQDEARKKAAAHK